MKKLVRVISISSVVALGAIAVPVSAGAAPAPGENVSVTAQALHGAAARIVDPPLDQVDLRPDQKEAIGKLGSEAEARYAPVERAKRDLMVKVADQLDRGEINRCQLNSQIQSLASAKAKVSGADRAAFEKLHDILDADQRADFVDALKSEWESVKRAHQPSAIVDKMGKELNLSADQKADMTKIVTGLETIKQAQPAVKQHQQRWGRILDAFKGDHFSLDEIAPAGDVQAKIADKIDARLWASEAVVPALNQEQRTLVAKKLRQRAESLTGSQSGSQSGSAHAHGAHGMSPAEED